MMHSPFFSPPSPTADPAESSTQPAPPALTLETGLHAPQPLWNTFSKRTEQNRIEQRRSKLMKQSLMDHEVKLFPLISWN